MTRIHTLELSLAICFFGLGYLTCGMIHRSFRIKPEGYIITIVALVLLVLNWG